MNEKCTNEAKKNEALPLNHSELEVTHQQYESVQHENEQFCCYSHFKMRLVCYVNKIVLVVFIGKHTSKLNHINQFDCNESVKNLLLMNKNQISPTCCSVQFDARVHMINMS